MLFDCQGVQRDIAYSSEEACSYSMLRGRGKRLLMGLESPNWSLIITSMYNLRTKSPRKVARTRPSIKQVYISCSIFVLF